MRNSKVKGFTLVELIVVIAIIAILAAILVPNMLSYIKQSRYTQADANAKNVHTAATAALAQAYVDGVLGEEDAGGGDNGGNGGNNAGKSGVAKLETGSNPFTATVNGTKVDVPGLDPASYSGSAAFSYDGTTLAVKAAAWSKSKAAESFNGTVPSQEDQYTAKEIVGYYPTPVKGAAGGAAAEGGDAKTE